MVLKSLHFQKKIYISTIYKMIPRYSRKEITEVWDPKNKFQIWLNIEILICEALNKYGKIPDSALKKYKKKSKI